MNSDDCKALLFVSVIPAPQLRDDVFAIDSAVGPELDQYDLVLQIVQCQWLAIDPRTAGNFRSGAAMLNA